MLKDTDYVEVQNLANHPVAYVLEGGGRRSFRGQEKKKILVSEIRHLSYSFGGLRLIRDYLRVNDRALAEEFGVEEFDAEYQWTKQDVIKLLESGSNDRLEDALDFAPQGIYDLIVDAAVEIRLGDRNKCDIILKHTGKDINKMIEKQKAANEAIANENGAFGRVGAKKRRVAVDEGTEAAPAKKTRRTTTRVDKVAEQPGEVAAGE